MNREESRKRTVAAIERLKPYPIAGLTWLTITVFAAIFRALVHLCIGFGGASTAGLSLWWGFPLALLSSQTLGQLWGWIRRGARVRALESYAADCEARVTRGGQ